MHSNFIYSLLMFPVVSKAGKSSNETCCPIQACAGKIVFSYGFLLTLHVGTICLNLFFSFAVSVGPFQSDSVLTGLRVCFVGATTALITCITPYSQMAANLGRARGQTWNRGGLG